MQENNEEQLNKEQEKPQEPEKGYDKRTWVIVVLVAVLIVGGLVLSQTRESQVVVTSFEECVAVTGIAAESYPRQCFYNGQTFVEAIEDIEGPQDLSYDPENTIWKKAEFPESYQIDLEVFYPSSWDFSCCGDKGSESNHFFIPPGTKLGDFKSSRVILTDYYLVTCPDQGGSGCSVDDLVTADVDSFFIQKITELDGIAENLGTRDLPNINSDVLVYQGRLRPESTLTDNDNEIYLIKTDNNVFTITFQGRSNFSEVFISDFTSRLKGDINFSN